jgi:hypothetical protein
MTGYLRRVRRSDIVNLHKKERVIMSTFSQAIEYMKDGESVKLPQWQDDVFISIQKPDENSKMTAPYFYVTSRFGMVPWIPTMIEMFSEKWQISSFG